MVNYLYMLYLFVFEVTALIEEPEKNHIIAMIFECVNLPDNCLVRYLN